jgi:hypothetical protein
MPAGPYVESYSVILKKGIRRSELGEYPVYALLNVKWKDVVTEAIQNRKNLLGPNQKTLDIYHSQASFACNSLLLNEVKRKINRAKMNYDIVRRLKLNTSAKWDELIYELHMMVRERLKFDISHVDDYIEEHKTSTIIPSTPFNNSKKWSQLSSEGKIALYDLCAAYLEDLENHYDDLRTRILKPNAVGRGIRARSADVESIQATYDLEYIRSRQVAFIPFLSAWFAFLTKEDKDAIWMKLKDTAESILGMKVLLPPIEKGAYWYKIAEAMQSGLQIVNGDGSNWETYSANLSEMYCEAVNDGIPQYMSGTAMTSINATFAMLRCTESRLPNRAGL